MAGKDEQVVILSVQIDEAQIARDAKAAQDRINKGLQGGAGGPQTGQGGAGAPKAAAKPKDKDEAGKSPKTLAERLLSVMSIDMKKITTSFKNLGQMAAASVKTGDYSKLPSYAADATKAAAPVLLITAALAAVGYAFKKFFGMLDGMLEKFAQFNPILAAQTAKFGIIMQQLNRQTGEAVRPVLEIWLKIKTQFAQIWSDMLPVLRQIGTVLGSALLYPLLALSYVIRGLIFAVKFVIYGIEKGVVAMLKGIDAMTFHVIPGLAKLADGMNREAESVNPWNGGNLAANAASWNKAFVNSLRAGGPAGPAAVRRGGGAGGGVPQAGGPAGAGGGVGRVAIPHVSLPDFTNKINITAQFKLAHDQAVRDAVAALKNQIMGAMDATRREARHVAMMLDAGASVL